jgi:hypothetical protein
MTLAMALARSAIAPLGYLHAEHHSRQQQLLADLIFKPVQHVLDDDPVVMGPDLRFPDRATNAPEEHFSLDEEVPDILLVNDLARRVSHRSLRRFEGEADFEQCLGHPRRIAQEWRRADRRGQPVILGFDQPQDLAGPRQPRRNRRDAAPLQLHRLGGAAPSLLPLAGLVHVVFELGDDPLQVEHQARPQ